MLRKKELTYSARTIFFCICSLSLPIILTFWQPEINTVLTWDNPSAIATIINGITAPLLSSLAIWVTFKAFWVQYESNTNQLNISEIQRASTERQMQDIKKERFENRFFNFINLLHEQEKDTVIPTIGCSKQAYHFMFYEYKAICFQIIKFGVYKNMEGRRKMELDQAFHLFLNGVSESSISRLSEDSKEIDIDEIKRMNEYLLTQQDYYIKSGNMPKYLKDYSNNKMKLFDGHRLHLVSFYRTFCMTLQYLYKSIDKSEIEDVKLYRNILLAQFSEHEIALLRIMYLYGKEQNLMFIDKLYQKRIDKFFNETIMDYIISKTMNSESEGFIDV